MSGKNEHCAYLLDELLGAGHAVGVEFGIADAAEITHQAGTENKDDLINVSASARFSKSAQATADKIGIKEGGFILVAPAILALKTAQKVK